MKTKDITLYILIRTDLPSQGPGRACAQSNHAASVLEHEFKNHADLKLWKAQTKYGYGTCIVLGATKAQIQEVFDLKAMGDTSCKGWVIDPDYAISISSELEKFIDLDKLADAGASLEPLNDDPSRCILHRPEATCAYILGGKADLAPYLGHLSLYQG